MMFNFKKGEIMKKIKTKSAGNNFKAIEIGKLAELKDYSYLHPKLKTEILGKLFLGEMLESTGVEISFQVVPPNTTIPFLHSHKNHEEIYLILNGKGEFQVDDDTFELEEGSVIRVAPEGKRTWKSSPDSSMTIIVIQSKVNSLENYCVEDGFRVEGEILVASS